jgi:hypothetical protein
VKGKREFGIQNWSQFHLKERVNIYIYIEMVWYYYNGIYIYIENVSYYYPTLITRERGKLSGDDNVITVEAQG